MARAFLSLTGAMSAVRGWAFRRTGRGWAGYYARAWRRSGERSSGWRGWMRCCAASPRSPACAREGCDYRASAVLDATWRHAWLAEKLGLFAERQEPAQRVRFGWKKEEQPELDGQPLFRQRADGWDWCAPLGDGRCAWAKLRRTSAGGGIDYAWRIFRACAGPGYFLLGDAACLMDPSAANGVLRALLSGICAAHLIATAQPAAAADAYQRWIAELFDRSFAEWKTAAGNSGPVLAAA